MILFNGYPLQNAEIITSKINNFDMPKRETQKERLALQNGFVTLRDYYNERVTNIEGYISAASREELANKIDEMKFNLSGANRYLTIDSGNGERILDYATLSSLEFPQEHWNIDFVPYNATFVSFPFFREASNVVEGFFDITADSFTGAATIEGTVSPHLLTIEIDVSAANNLSSITFKNITTGTETTINHTFALYDIIHLSVTNNRVTVNGTEVDFDGPFPVFEIGENSFELSAVSNSHDLGVTFIYHRSYL